MIITEKDIGCTIIHGTQYYNGSIADYSHTVMVIPNFYKSADDTFSIGLDQKYCKSNQFKEMVDFITEHIVPNYQYWHKKENIGGGIYLSDQYNVIFDVDEEIVLYFKLKFCY